ncbi:MAG: hypothetical protein AAGJ46_19390 [Planctomycetota bacterium]
MLSFADEEHDALIEGKVRFGKDFAPPAQREFRRHRNERPERLLEPHEILAALEATKEEQAAEHYRAFLLLGINRAFGWTDCSRLGGTT